MAMQVELRSVVAATGQSAYGAGVPSAGMSGSNAGAGIAGAGSGSSLSGGYRSSANGGPDAGGYYGRGGSYSAYSSYNHGGYSPSSGQNEEQNQKETKYYYGGKYQGSCVADGLYYRDDTTFVICSNGYPHEQPCPPGTKTSGSPRYQAGYYYGYTDLCSVNLVDYGYGPEYYAPRGYPEDAAAGPGRELQSSYGGAQGNSRSNGAQGQGSSSFGGLSSSSNGNSNGGPASAGIGSAASPAYDRSRSYGARESDFGAQPGFYGGGSASAGLNKNRPYDFGGNGYNGKKDAVQPSSGYGRDPSGVPRSAGFGFGDNKSPSAGSPSYQSSSAADNSFASKPRDASAFSLSKSGYFGSSDNKKFI